MQKSPQYDAVAVQRLAGRLQRRATFVIVLWPVIGILVGVVVGLQIVDSLGAVVGGLVGAFAGYLIGSMRYLFYRVQAQQILCMRQIEDNTRRHGVSPDVAAHE